MCNGSLLFERKVALIRVGNDSPDYERSVVFPRHCICLVIGRDVDVALGFDLGKLQTLANDNEQPFFVPSRLLD